MKKDEYTREEHRETRTTNNRDLCGSGDRKVYKRKRDIAKGGDRWMEGGKKRGRKMGKGGRETNGGVKRFGTRYVNTDVTGSSHGIRIQAKFDFSSRYRVFREWKIVEIYFYLLCFLVSRKLDAKKSWLRSYRLSIENILMKFNIFFLLTLSVYFTMSGLLRYWSQK